jgi:hypothetical protein
MPHLNGQTALKRRLDVKRMVLITDGIRLDFQVVSENMKKRQPACLKELRYWQRAVCPEMSLR